MFVDSPGKLGIPTLISVSHSTIKICYEPPANSDKVLIYMTKYRKDGETEWQAMPETTSLTETVTGLDQNSFYEITVSAKYDGGQWGPPSDPIRVKTDSSTAGKCCLWIVGL